MFQLEYLLISKSYTDPVMVLRVLDQKIVTYYIEKIFDKYNGSCLQFLGTNICEVFRFLWLIVEWFCQF